MSKADLVNALMPHLIAVLPQPFSPDEARAKQVLDTAIKWAELIHAEANKDKTLHLFTVG